MRLGRQPLASCAFTVHTSCRHDAEANIATIKSLYEALGRGDVDAILDGVIDGVDWAVDAGAGSAPWHGAATGKDGVASFFADLGEPRAAGAHSTDLRRDRFRGADVHQVPLHGQRHRQGGRDEPPPLLGGFATARCLLACLEDSELTSEALRA